MTSTTSNHGAHNALRGLVLATVTAVCCAPALATAGPAKGNSGARIDVTYAADCRAATVSSTKDVSNIVSVIDVDGQVSWQKFDDLPEVEEYTVEVDPALPASARVLTVFVKSGSYKQVDTQYGIPGRVGMQMHECVPA